MIDELRRIFQEFATERDLICTFDKIDGERYALTFQDQQRSWGYRRLLSEDEIYMFAGSAKALAESVLNLVTKKLRAHHINTALRR